MSAEEYRQSCMADCDMAAQDCKGAADYAAYAFKQRDEEAGRKYVARLLDCVSSLKSHLASLDYANRKVKEEAAS